MVWSSIKKHTRVRKGSSRRLQGGGQTDTVSGEELDQLARPNHSAAFSLIPVQKDGRCLFRAIVVTVARMQGSMLSHEAETLEADGLRASTYQEITGRRREWFVQQGIIQGDFDDYCQELKKKTTPAGEVEVIVLSFILERCIIVHGWQGSCYRPIESFGSQYKGNQSPILVTYTATGEGHYDGLVPMEPIPGASRPQRCRRKAQRFGQVDEERMMLANTLQTLPAGEQTQGALPADLMGTVRNRVAELRRVMESHSSAHLNTVKLLEERMRCTREPMPLSNIHDELVRALQPMTECGQLATVRPRTFCADDCRGYAPLPCCNQRHPVLRRMGRTNSGATWGRDHPRRLASAF